MAIPLGDSFEEACFGSTIPSKLLPVLEGNDFFYGVNHSLVDEYLPAFRLAYLPTDTILYGRKSVSSCVFLILGGAVQMTYPVIGRQLAGEALHSDRFTGEASLMRDRKPVHPATAKCTDATLLCWARADDLSGLLETEPQVALNVARSLHARVTYTLTVIDQL